MWLNPFSLDSCVMLEARLGPVKILEDKQSSQRVMALALPEILATGCKFQMDREASKVAPNTGSKPDTLPLHIARSQPVQSNCCQCDVKGSSLAKGKSTNKSSAGSYLQHVLFWISSFSNLTLVSSQRLSRRSDYISYHTHKFGQLLSFHGLQKSS